MPAPVALVLGLAGLAVATAAGGKSGGTSKSKPKSTEAKSTNEQIEDILKATQAFSKTIYNSAALPTQPDYKKLAETARALQSNAEAASKARIDKWADDAATTALKHVVTAPAVPFIYLGAWAAKKTQDWLKHVFYNNGWTEEWVAALESETSGLLSSGIPFPFFNKNIHTSPMGYIVSGGGDTCVTGSGSDGLCNLRHEFFDASLMNDAQRTAALNQWARIRDHMRDNPYSLAVYVLIQAFTQPDWTQGAPNSDELNGGTYKTSQQTYWYNNKPQWWNDQFYPFSRVVDDRTRFWYLLVAAIATTMCQDYGTNMTKWKGAIEAAWHGWNEGVKLSRDRFRSLSDYREKQRVPSDGALGFAMASQAVERYLNPIIKPVLVTL